MPTRSLSYLSRYVLAVISVAVAFTIDSLMPKITQAPAILFLAAVAVSAWHGLGPGLVATVLSVVLLDMFFFAEPIYVDLGVPIDASIAVFSLAAILICWLNAERRRLEHWLREENRRKGEFLAVLAHELRNFMSPVSPALALLRVRGGGDPVILEVCTRLDRQMRNMTFLVNDLLDLTRIKEGKIQLHTARIDLAEVVREVTESVRPSFESRRHELTVSMPPGPLPIEADRTRLEQILNNLLSNAAKYTDPGGHVRLCVERAQRDWLIRVSDDGIGIEPRMLPHLFGLFIQAEPGSRGGLGVGLHLVHQLVEMHQGEITAHSRGRGQGSEFVVRLPANKPVTRRD